MMSDNLLYSGDDAAMMSELQHFGAAGIECSSGIRPESEAGLSVETSLALASQCSLTFPWKWTY